MPVVAASRTCTTIEPAHEPQLVVADTFCGSVCPSQAVITIGYHNTQLFCMSTTNIRGQMLPAGADSPIEGPCQAVDFELEMVSMLRTVAQHGTARHVVCCIGTSVPRRFATACQQ